MTWVKVVLAVAEAVIIIIAKEVSKKGN